MIYRSVQSVDRERAVQVRACRVIRLVGSACLAVGALFATAPDARAQLLLGVRAGSGSTSLKGDKPRDATYTGHRGFSLGVLVGVPVGDGILLVAEPGFVERGTGLAFAVPNQDELRDSVDLSLKYVTLPLGLRVVSDGGRFFVSSTVDLSYLISADVDEGSGPRDVSDAVNPLEVSVRFGVGVHIPVGRPVLTLEFGYEQSARNLTNDSVTPPEWSFPPRFLVRGFRISGGLQIEVGGAP